MLLKTSYLSVLLIILLYVLSGLLSKSLALVDGQNVFAVWLPTGFALAFLIFYKLKKFCVLSIFIGAFLFNSIVANNAIILSLMIAIGNTLGPFIVAFLYMKKQQEGYILFHEQNVLILFVVSILGAGISSFIGSGSLFLYGIISPEIFSHVVLTWFTGDLLGYLVVTPILLYFLEKVWKKEIQTFPNLKLRVVVFSSLMIGVCYLIFFIPKGIDSSRGFEALPVLFLILSTVVAGIAGSIFTTIIFVLMAVLGTVFSSFGPFHITNENINTILLLLQLYIGSSIMTVYFFIAVTYNRYKQLLEINEKDKMLQQQSKMASMGEMLENIAHQWRQPLSVITSAASGIEFQKQLGLLSDDMLAVQIATIKKSALHLSDTVNDFRDFYKEDKKADSFSIEKVIDKALILVSSKFKTRDITIVKNIQEIRVNGFENEFIQVLMNIFNNARDELEKQNDDRVVFIDLYKQESMVFLKITDNAGGVPNDIIDKIFDPYFTTKNDQEGTGIGLYMSQKIIQEHFLGEIRVMNKKVSYKEKNYLGAEFTISFKSTVQ